MIVLSLIVIGVTSRVLVVHSARRAHDARFGSLVQRLTSKNWRDESEFGSITSNAVLLILPEMDAIGRVEPSSDEKAEIRHERFQEMVNALGTNLEPIVPRLREEYLSDKHTSEAGWALVASGSKGWAALVEGLSSTNIRIQTGSIDALSYTGDAQNPEAIARIVKLSTNGGVVVRVFAAIYFGKLTNDVNVAVPTLVNMLRLDTDEAVRVSSAKSLAHFRQFTPIADEAIKFAWNNDSSQVVRDLAGRLINERN
jgi:hypothetical protein